MKITFPELPVALECFPKEFSELISICRCGNMDAYKVTIAHKGKVLIFYFTGVNLAFSTEELLSRNLQSLLP